MANSINSTQPVRGMRDFLPHELNKRVEILNIIRSTVKNYGFQEIETPCVEDINKLHSKQGGENELMIYQILKRGIDTNEPIKIDEAVDLGLRYDLTMPLSRYIAANQGKIPQVFRAFQTGCVWRAERPQKGRYRQFYQCDIDILGPESHLPAEIEVVSVGCAVLKKLGLAEGASVHVNDRRLLDDVMKLCDIPEDLRGRVLIELDKLDKTTPDKVQELIGEIERVSAAASEKLLKIIMQLKDGKTDIEGVNLYDIPQIMSAVKEMNPEVDVVFDPTLVRGMGYYTGAIFEVKLAGETSSICGGGRYDKMVGKWLGKDVDAVGFSLGFERFIDIVDDKFLSKREGIAIGYRSEEEYLKALKFRAKCIEKCEFTGLVHMPSKLKSSFFDQLAEDGYVKLITPERFELGVDEAIEAAKAIG